MNDFNNNEWDKTDKSGMANDIPNSVNEYEKTTPWKISRHMVFISLSTLSLIIVILTVVIWQFAAGKGIDTDDKSLSNAKTENSAVNNTTLNAGEQTTTPTQLPLYIVGEWEHKLAIFNTLGDEPFEIFDVYITSLPKEEQKRLTDGIKVYSDEELHTLIEDYTS